ncbi:MAG: hypothetical protein LBL60_00080 [Mycoplasmataceae bacterium]|jgi:hypothetical protein|nr:hypothetical protein [Mycoplasmataceae bacterium]
MNKVKINLEIDQDVYEKLKQQFNEIIKNPSVAMQLKSVDAYLESILTSFAKSGDQMKVVSGKFKDLLDKMGGMGDLGNIDLSKLNDLNFEDLFGNSQQKKTEAKKPAPTTNASKLKS